VKTPVKEEAYSLCPQCLCVYPPTPRHLKQTGAESQRREDESVARSLRATKLSQHELGDVDSLLRGSTRSAIAIR
jgi:hypothetical protein